MRTCNRRPQITAPANIRAGTQAPTRSWPLDYLANLLYGRGGLCRGGNCEHGRQREAMLLPCSDPYGRRYKCWAMFRHRGSVGNIASHRCEQRCRQRFGVDTIGSRGRSARRGWVGCCIRSCAVRGSGSRTGCGEMAAAEGVS